MINLLQGAYSPQAHWGRWLRPWRAAAALASVWLLVQGFSLTYEHWSLRREQTALRAAMEQVYKGGCARRDPDRESQSPVGNPPAGTAANQRQRRRVSLNYCTGAGRR